MSEVLEEELIKQHDEAMAGIAETRAYDEHMSYDYETKYDKVPETINMFEQIADNVHREINPNKRTSMEQAADAQDPNYKSDAELIANEVNLIKEQGFMDYLKGTMYKKRGSK